MLAKIALVEVWQATLARAVVVQVRALASGNRLSKNTKLKGK